MPADLPKALPTQTKITVGVLLAIPLLSLAWVSSYAKATPRLWGFPFFYWYQLLWVFLTPALTWAAYVLIRRARDE